MRTIYTIIKAYQYYHDLKNIVKNTPNHRTFAHITDIKPADLKRLGVAFLVLDFDGVLNAHGELLPRPEVIQWLEDMQALIGADHIMILSNRPVRARIQFFEAHFPEIEFIQGVRKKPYPDGLDKACDRKGVPRDKRDQVVLIDDRLLTGMLATCIAGCQGIYIREPYVQLFKRPIVERFFQILRWAERWIIY